MTRFDTREMVSAQQAVREHTYEARRFVTSAAVGVIAGAVVAYALSPGVRDWMVQEDGPIENLTAFTFLLGAVAGGWKWTRLASRPAWLLVVPAAAFVGFLDEVSFGARLFGWAPPRVSGIDVDSVHDLFDLTERWAEVGLGLGRS